MNDLKNASGLDLQEYHLEIKLQEWEVRYHNFKHLITRPGVDYDEEYNYVAAPRDVWVDIEKVCIDVFFYAYMFMLLMWLF